MKAVLEFELPSENADYTAAKNGALYQVEVGQFSQYLRQSLTEARSGELTKLLNKEGISENAANIIIYHLRAKLLELCPLVLGD